MIAAAATAVLSQAAGLDLDLFRPDYVRQRIERALAAESVASVDELARLMRREPEVRARFRRSIAVSVSGLYRDPEQFELLEQKVLPTLVRGDRTITVWSAGCADGTELCTLSLLLERSGWAGRSFLLGSDLLQENIVRAKATAARLREEGALSQVPRWEVRDLVRDGPPPGKWRVVLCRNVSIYLAPPARDRLFANIASALALDGTLVLGRTERIISPARYGLRRLDPHMYTPA